MAQNKGKSRNKQQKHYQPSDNSIFEMLIRFDEDLKSVTTRLLWLLWVMSRNKQGIAIFTERQLALQLHTSPGQMEQSIHLICKVWGYFDHKQQKGVHRPWLFKLKKRSGEADLDAKLRMWADTRTDAAVILHWKASDETVETGTAQFSCAELQISEKTMRRARKVMNELGHFTVDSGTGGRNKAATYTRVQPNEIQRQRMLQIVELVRTQPDKVKIAARQQGQVVAINTEDQPVPAPPAQRSKRIFDWDEHRRYSLNAQFREEERQRQDEAQRQARLAFEFGIGLTPWKPPGVDKKVKG